MPLVVPRADLRRSAAPRLSRSRTSRTASRIFSAERSRSGARRAAPRRRRRLRIALPQLRRRRRRAPAVGREPYSSSSKTRKPLRSNGAIHSSGARCSCQPRSSRSPGRHGHEQARRGEHPAELAQRGVVPVVVARPRRRRTRALSRPTCSSVEIAERELERAVLERQVAHVCVHVFRPGREVDGDELRTSPSSRSPSRYAGSAFAVADVEHAGRRRDAREAPRDLDRRARRSRPAPRSSRGRPLGVLARARARASPSSRQLDPLELAALDELADEPRPRTSPRSSRPRSLPLLGLDRPRAARAARAARRTRPRAEARP